MDPQNVEYSPKTTGNRVINRAEKILKSPLVRTLQWISKFCKNKGVLLIFFTYGVFYSLIKKGKRFALCVLRTLSQLASFELFGNSKKFKI